MTRNDTAHSIDFYFDFISPNAYLAWHALKSLVGANTISINPIPVLFAGLLAHFDQRGPAEIRSKALWMGLNVQRKARALDLGLRPPASHPFNPLAALRLSLCANAETSRSDLVDLLFSAIWEDAVQADDPGQLSDYVSSRTPSLLVDSVSPDSNEVKAKLRANTDSAIQLGVFGVPIMIAGSEMFFGYDDVGFLEEFVMGRDTIDAEDIKAWKALTPSAWRSGKTRS